MRREIDSRCLSPMGVRAASEISFSTDAAAIAEALEATSEMLSIVEGEEDLPFGTLADFEALAGQIRVPGTFLTAQELYRLGASLATVAAIHTFFVRHRDPDIRSRRG